MISILDLILKQLMRFNDATLFLLIIINTLSVICLAISIVEIIRFRRTRNLVNESHLLQSEETPSISVICSVYNDELTVVEKTRALLLLQYPKFEIIIINNGSTDSTLKSLIQEFKLIRMDYYYNTAIPTRPIRDIYRSPEHPRLIVADIAHAGRSEALNTGINLSRYEFFCSVSPETLIETDALLLNAYPFVRWNNDVTASGSMARMINGCSVEDGKVSHAALPKSPLLLFQMVEGARTNLTGRFAWNALKATLILSDTFAIFRKRQVIESGGYSALTQGGTMELVFRLQHKMRQEREQKSILLLPQTVSWVEAPAKLKDLITERLITQRELLETAWTHRNMFLNPKFKTVGVLSFPILVLVDILAPLLETAAYATLLICFFLGMLQAGTLALFFAVTLLLAFLTSVCGLLIEELLFKRYGGLRHLGRLILMAFLENLGYRQIMLLTKTRAALLFLAAGKKKNTQIVL